MIHLVFYNYNIPKSQFQKHIPYPYQSHSPIRIVSIQKIGNKATYILPPYERPHLSK